MSVAGSIGSPTRKRAGVFDERVDEVVVDLALDVEALGRRAHLAGVEERGPRAAASGDLDLGRHVGADDERVLAAELEVHAGDPPRRALGDPRAGRDAAGERDPVHALVVHQPLADVAAARQQRDEPGRQVLDARRERERGERRELRRLAQCGVAGGQHGRELPGQQEQRVVPRHDAGDERRAAP